MLTRIVWPKINVKIRFIFFFTSLKVTLCIIQILGNSMKMNSNFTLQKPKVISSNQISCHISESQLCLHKQSMQKPFVLSVFLNVLHQDSVQIIILLIGCCNYKDIKTCISQRPGTHCNHRICSIPKPILNCHQTFCHVGIRRILNRKINIFYQVFQEIRFKLNFSETETINRKRIGS